MALTNFAALTDEQKTAWSMDIWKIARNTSFLAAFAGDASAMVHRVNELTQSEKGTRAVMTLVNDAQGDGVAGDNTLEGNEEALTSDEQVIRVDMLRHAHRSKGRMSEQKSIINFRKEARDTLGYWLSDRWDQMGILTLSGVAYSNKNSGGTRTGSQLVDLEFAADVTAPSANRITRYDATDGLLVNGAAALANTNLVAADTPTWRMLVDLKAYAVSQYLRPIRTESGVLMYVVIMSPFGIAALKRDSDFLNAWRHAQERGASNPLFKGTGHGATGIYVDGLAIYEFRHIYSGTSIMASGVRTQRVLFCGAQALGMADIGAPKWVEKDFDYENQQGISTGKICGFKKPVFQTPVTNTAEDYGVIVCDTAC